MKMLLSFFIRETTSSPSFPLFTVYREINILQFTYFLICITLNILLFSQNQTIKTLALEVISLLSRNKECVTEISACEILGQFLRIMKDDDFQKQRVLDTLSGLTNAPQLVKEAHSKGTLTWELGDDDDVDDEKGGKGANELVNECCVVCWRGFGG